MFYRQVTQEIYQRRVLVCID